MKARRERTSLHVATPGIQESIPKWKERTVSTEVSCIWNEASEPTILYGHA